VRDGHTQHRVCASKDANSHERRSINREGVISVSRPTDVNY
jgi:hypothetical protein